MSIETELDFLSPDSYSDSVSEETIDHSFITQSLDEGGTIMFSPMQYRLFQMMNKLLKT